MKKEDFKRIIKPIVQECITEAILESGMISKIIAEVMVGMNQGQVLSPKRRRTPEYEEDALDYETISENRKDRTETEKRRRREYHENEHRERIESEKAQKLRGLKIGGVNIFEDVKPITSGGTAGKASMNDLADAVDVIDPDIIAEIADSEIGDRWKQHMEKLRETKGIYSRHSGNLIRPPVRTPGKGLMRDGLTLKQMIEAEARDNESRLERGY